jgi:hypothetical protein
MHSAFMEFAAAPCNEPRMDFRNDFRHPIHPQNARLGEIDGISCGRGVVGSWLVQRRARRTAGQWGKSLLSAIDSSRSLSAASSTVTHEAG